jgi:hypothetical protein
MHFRCGQFHKAAAAYAALLVAVTAHAQPPPARPPTPNDSLISPRVAADGRVTISIYAPKASEASIIGDWLTIFASVPLQKGADGVWSIDVGPLPADFYSYGLIVDGVETLDPKNPMIKQGIAGVDNMFLVPGEGIAFADNQLVPPARFGRSGTNRRHSECRGACMFTPRPVTTTRTTRILCSICSTAAATRIRVGARSGAPASCSTTFSRQAKRCR